MKQYLARDVCSIFEAGAAANMPAWANLDGASLKGGTDRYPELAGGGVYACFWDNRLIYIGSFVGPKAEPFGGNVAERIYKHVLGFTLRAKALGFSPRPFSSIVANLGHEIASDLSSVDPETASRGSIRATFNKARFAAAHWNELASMTPDDLLNRFSFTYRRIELDGQKCPPKAFVKEGWIKPIERSLIRRFEPICNTEFRTSDDGEPASFDEVVAQFEAAFNAPREPWDQTALPDIETTVQPKQPCIESAEDEEAEEDPIWPVDVRWQVYTTRKGQLRIRLTDSGAVILVRESSRRVNCMASAESLLRLKVEASPTNRGPLISAVKIEDWSARETQAVIQTILEASTAEAAKRGRTLERA